VNLGCYQAERKVVDFHERSFGDQVFRGKTYPTGKRKITANEQSACVLYAGGSASYKEKETTSNQLVNLTDERGRIMNSACIRYNQRRLSKILGKLS
jgi:hypothetical protein